MDKAALLALADRVEALTGPDREFCADIWTTLAPESYQMALAPANKDGLSSEAKRFITVHLAPKYTTSLDAAMTLVPEGVGGEKMFLQLTVAPLGCNIVEHRCEVIDTIGGQKSCSKAATPALAITAAALRAIAGGEDA